MSYSLRSPIRTNKGREATETEGLVILIVIDNSNWLLLIVVYIYNELNKMK